MSALSKAVAVFGGYTMISRVTGFIRDLLIAKYLGAGMVADAFLVALRFPNLFRSLFAEGAFNVSFVPIFSGKLVSEGKDNAMEFANRAFSLLFGLLVVFITVIEFAMPAMIFLFAPGFGGDAEKLRLTIELTRITFPFLLFISIVSLESGILNSVSKFAAAAFSPTILNLTMISSLLVASAAGNGRHVYFLSYGLLIAGGLEVAWLYWFLRKEGVFLRFSKISGQLLNDDVKLLFKRTLPGIVGSGVYQINLFIDTFYVSFLVSGSVSWLYYATRLFQLPIGIFGAGMAVALLPILSKHIANRDLAEADNTMRQAILMVAVFVVPALVGMAVLSKEIIVVLFNRGMFTMNDVLPTANALIALAAGLPGAVMNKALTSRFYAEGDTKTPVRVAVITLLLNVVLNYILMRLMAHVGIAFATSLSTTAGTVIYFYLLKKRKMISFDKKLPTQLIKIVFAATLMGGVLKAALWYCGDGWLDGDFRIVILALLVGAGGIVFFLTIFACGVLSLSSIKNLLVRKHK